MLIEFLMPILSGLVSGLLAPQMYSTLNFKPSRKGNLGSLWLVVVLFLLCLFISPRDQIPAIDGAALVIIAAMSEKLKGFDWKDK